MRQSSDVTTQHRNWPGKNGFSSQNHRDWERQAVLGWVMGCMIALALLPQPANVCRGQGLPQSRLLFHPLRRDLKRSLTRAEQAIQEKRFSDAVIELDALLNGPEVEDYFIGAPADAKSEKLTSFKRRVGRLLGSLPRSGRESYELQFGATARRLLDQAIQEGNEEKLTEVGRRYFHTQAGYEATLLAGHYYLNQGRPLAAALLLRRLEEAPHAIREFDPEYSFLLATCWRYARFDDAAQAVLMRLKSRMPDAKLTVAGREIDLFGTADEALPWLDNVLGGRRDWGPLGPSQWLVYRGSAARNASSQGGVPLLNRRWRIPTANGWEDEQKVRHLSKQYLTSGVPALTALQPLAIGDTILTRSPHELVAINFRNGKRIWVYPWEREDWGTQFSRDDVSRSAADKYGHSQAELHQRIWEDAIYGQLSSDGSAVFFVDQLDYANVPGLMRSRIMPRPLGGVRPTLPRSANQLVALDLKTQGKLLWTLGSGPDGLKGDEPKLDDAFFLGPPLPVSGRLYALVEMKEEVRLVVLDARTGRLVWSQHLAHFEMPQQMVSTDSLRRLAGATPSFADGILICPISAGAIVAVDLATRSLLWPYSYKTYSDNRRRSFGVWNRASFSQPRGHGNRWSDATVTVANGHVLLTPVESDELHCLDLVTGKSVWPSLPRKGNLFVACVHQNIAVLVGKDQISGIGLQDGKPTWKKPLSLPARTMPSGRGFLTDDHYYLPTTEPSLLRINVLDGTFQSTPTEYPLGNLICHQGQVISQSSESVEAFHIVHYLRKAVDEKLTQNQFDPWALEHHGMLLLNEGKYTEAIGPLRQALRRYPEATSRRDATRAMLIESLLAALRQDFATNKEFASDLNDLIDQPRQRAEYLRLMAEGLEKTGENARAFDTYLEIAETDNRSSLPRDADGALTQISSDLRVDSRRWLQSVIHRLWNTASPSDQQRMLTTITQRGKSAMESQNVSRLKRFTTYFYQHPASQSARLRLAEMLVASEEWLEAESLLKTLSDSTDEWVAARATLLTAQVLERSGQFRDSVKWYRQLARQWPDVTLPGGKTAQEIIQTFPADSKIATALLQPDEWPFGAVAFEEVKPTTQRTSTRDPFHRFRTTSRPIVVPLLQSDGEFADDVRVVLARGQLNSIGLMDGLGNVSRRITLSRPEYPQVGRSSTATVAKTYGHVLLVSFGAEIVAIDALSPESEGLELLWRENVSPQLPGTIASQRRIVPLTMPTPWGETQTIASINGKPVGILGTVTELGVCYQIGQELRCVDPLTNRPWWIRDDVAAGCDLFGDDQLVFAVSYGDTSARVFSRIDGSELGQRPVPPLQRRWTTVGRHILTWDKNKSGLQLRLHDPWTRRDTWSYTFAAQSKGQLIRETGEAAIMQPNGRFVMIAIENGEKRIDVQLQPEPRLKDIHVAMFPNQFLLFTNRPSSGQSNARIPKPQTADRRFNGHVYAFDRFSGQFAWPSPAYLEDYDFPLDQPKNLPLLTLMRHASLRVPNRSPSTRTSLLFVDRRDGRRVLQKEGTSHIQSTRSSGDLDAGTVTVSIPNRTEYVFRFTKEPRSPEPPVQTGKLLSITTEPRKSRLAEAAGNAIKKVLGRLASEVLDPPPSKDKDADDLFGPAPAKKKPQEKP